ncbi:MAG: serine--tRNA ligase [Bacteroidetes bacterium]|nr:serine--tRNA ligase [Bacteroidota bacterium]MCK6610421.1 serine--tRNA ligase [Bacteroidia bacterium]
MLQIQTIRENLEDVKRKLAKKLVKNLDDLDELLRLDDEKRQLKVSVENNQAEANQLAKKIGELMKAGQKEEAEQLKLRSTELKELARQGEEELKSLEEKSFQILVSFPNMPSDEVPEGKTPEENINVYQWGEVPTLHEAAVPHWDLIKKYDLIDFELGVKIAGAGFPVYKNKGARLQRALINFFLDEATKAGYTEVQPPIVVNADSGFGTGQLPDKEGQMYHVTADELYLIPTAEVPITNLYRDVILKEEDLPIKNVGYTPCFRREAGAWGAHVRGLNRLHQFDKVEIVQLAHPDSSYQILEEMVKHVQGLLEKLELPYRILRLCGGDMGFSSALTYDFETYSAAQQRWLEVSSTSNFESFQANRMKCRFKPKEGKNQLVHTLNGSALALPRIVATLLENNQTPEGIRIPKALVPYTGFDFIS